MEKSIWLQSNFNPITDPPHHVRLDSENRRINEFIYKLESFPKNLYENETQFLEGGD